MGFAWHKLYKIVVDSVTGEIWCIPNGYTCVGPVTSGEFCYTTGYGVGGITDSGGIGVGVITGDLETICVTVTGQSCTLGFGDGISGFISRTVLPWMWQTSSGRWHDGGAGDAASIEVHARMNEKPWCPIDVRFETPRSCWRANAVGQSGGVFCHTDLQTADGGIPFYLRSPSSPSSIPGLINLQRVSLHWYETLLWPKGTTFGGGEPHSFNHQFTARKNTSCQQRILVVSGYNREHFVGPYVPGVGCSLYGITAFNKGIIDGNQLERAGGGLGGGNGKIARNTLVYGSTTGSSILEFFDPLVNTDYVRGVTGIKALEESLGRSFPLSHDVLAFPLFGGWNYVNYSPTGSTQACYEGADCGPVECEENMGCRRATCARCNYPPDPWKGVGHYTPYIAFSNQSGTDPSFGPYGLYCGCTGAALTQGHPICPGHTSTHRGDGRGIGPFSFACFNAHGYFNSTGVGDSYYHESPDVGNQGIPVCSVWSLLHAIYYRIHADIAYLHGSANASKHLHYNITPDSWKNLDPSGLTGFTGDFQMVRHVMERVSDAVMNQGLSRDYTDPLDGGATATTGGLGSNIGGKRSQGTNYGPNWSFVYPNVFLWDKDAYLAAGTNEDKWKHLYVIGNSNIIYDSQVSRPLYRADGSSYTGSSYTALIELDECSHEAVPGSTHNARFIGFGSADNSGHTSGPAQISFKLLAYPVACGTGTDENNYYETYCNDLDDLCDEFCNDPNTWLSYSDAEICRQCRDQAENCPNWVLNQGNFQRYRWDPDGSGAVVQTAVYGSCGLTSL